MVFGREDDGRVTPAVMKFPKGHRRSIYDASFENNMHRLDGSYSVHLWNEKRRKESIDKDATFPSGSLIEHLKRKYF